MASATLREIEPLDATNNERWFLITDVNPSTGPCVGSAGLVVSDATFASYEWSSRADEVHSVATRVSAGELAASDVLHNGDLSDYLNRIGIDVAAALAARAEPLNAIGDACSLIAAGKLDVFEQDAIYAFEDDRHLADAADALSPLPSWARTEFMEAGGIGFSYTQPCLVLAENHSLNDLGAHLATVGREVC